MNDAALQQAHEEAPLHCQVVAVLCIGVDLYGLNHAEMLTVIISAHDAPGLKNRKILRIGGDIHLKAAALVVFNIP